MKIDSFDFEKTDKTFIIAELSANHNQNYDLAVDTIKKAKECGADAIKLQTYTADTITIESDKEWFKLKNSNLWDGKTFYELYKEAYTPWDWQPKLMELAKEIGLICFSSPFDFSAVDFLEELDVPAYKIASFEITDIPLIEYTASKMKPIIISTGIATIDDIDLAVETCKKVGNNEIALLKCTSAYPAPYEEMNILTMQDIAKKYNVIIGLSDHSIGAEIPIASVALGARIVEKHFILDKKHGGVDSDFSMEPDEFKHMVNSIRNVEKSLGKVSYDLSERVANSRKFSRSLFVVKDVKKGDLLTEDNIRSIRPGAGLHPKFYSEIIGKKASVDIEKGTPLSFELIS